MKAFKPYLIVILLALVVLTGTLFGYSVSAQAFSGSGAGTSGSPYRIETCDQLHSIRDSLSAYYILVSDVDCTGYSFQPIGVRGSSDFTGNLNGQGFSISNLTITANKASLIASALNATIENINIVGGTITGLNDQTGSFVANAESSTLRNLTSTATVSGTSTVGGLVGSATASSTLSASSFNGSLTATGANAGGLLGVMFSNVVVSDSYSRGTMSGSSTVGGVVGRIFYGGSMTKVYSAMDITASSDTVGGLAGGNSFNSPTISHSFFVGTVTAPSATIGGIIGSNSSTTLTGNYFATTTCANCTNGASGSGSDTGGTGVSGVTVDGSGAPTSNWTFPTIWQVVSGQPPALVQPTAPTQPSGPTSFAATKVGNVPQLTWGAPSTAGSGSRTDYEIQYKASTDSGWTAFAHTANASLTGMNLTDLTIGKTYSFRVRAINTLANGTWATLTDALTLNGGTPTGVKSGISLKNSSDGGDLTTTDPGGTVIVKLTDAVTGQVYSTFTLDLSTNRDVSTISASTDITTGKTVIVGIGGIAGVGTTHSLYVPKLDGQNHVRICPNATTLDEISADCSGGTTYREGDANVSVVTVGSQSYWVVSGLTGTGGVGLALATSTSSGSTTPTPSPVSTDSTTSATLAETGSNHSLSLILSFLMLCLSVIGAYASRRYALVQIRK